MQDCECKLWDKNIDHYNEMFNFVEKYHGPSYEGDDYSFCPWCGMDLAEVDSSNGDEDEYDEEEEDEEIDTTPMHGEEEEDDEDEEESSDWDYELEFEPIEISYPVMSEGWVSEN